MTWPPATIALQRLARRAKLGMGQSACNHGDSAELQFACGAFDPQPSLDCAPTTILIRYASAQKAHLSVRQTLRRVHQTIVFITLGAPTGGSANRQTLDSVPAYEVRLKDVMIVRLQAISQYVKSALTVPHDPELVQAELAAFTKQVPLMYVLVMINMMALAITQLNVAPNILTIYIPAALDVVCCIRIISWWRSRSRKWTAKQAIRRLQGTVLTAGILGACFTAWSLSLFPYGDAYAKGHVAFFMAVTAIGCAFCLMHLRAAMLMIMAFVTIPFVAFFTSTGNPTLILISINFALVALAVVFMLLVNYRGFEQLVDSQRALRESKSELQVLSDQNFIFSNIDILTTLPNRRRFFTEIEKCVIASRNNGNKLALGMIDLDGFKVVNDVYGHSSGDQLLWASGQRLRTVLDNNTFVARIGGDEFVVITEYRDAEALLELGSSICAALAAPFEFKEMLLSVGCTVGISCFPNPATSAEKLFEQADYALYFAKQHSRGGVVVYAAQHEAAMRRSGVVAQALANADIESEFWMAYQPIVDATTMQTIAFEALARWKSPTLGEVSPDTFIPSAERSGLISKLTLALFRKALEDATSWPDNIRLSFNLSALDVNSSLSFLRIIAALEGSSVSSSRIDFEVTETAVMRDLKQAHEALSVLKQTGARIALDDFGTGFSSLSCIQELPVDKIKIDRSFISATSDHPSSSIILRSMINLCHNLELDCVVEGVETVEQMTLLQREGCKCQAKKSRIIWLRVQTWRA
jgi:diguanylate cyclase (GGDEF)-like protein